MEIVTQERFHKKKLSGGLDDTFYFILHCTLVFDVAERLTYLEVL